MEHSSQPYLSFVIASRNDGYTGSMVRRLQVCASAFIDQAERFGIPSELILVDWNPPARKALWDAIRWPRIVRTCTIRVITVPRRLHDLCPLSDRLPILIHRARNVGVRRARGRFILPTSPDILLSDELAAWISRRELDPVHMYRIARHDVPERALEYNSHAKRLTYCQKHVRRVHGRGPSYRLPGLPELFTNGSGDFTMLSREMYFRLHGIPEEREFHSMHFDSVFCFMAYAAGAQETELKDPLRIYHVDHGTSSWQSSASWLERVIARVPLGRKRSKRLMRFVRRIAPPRSTLDRRGIPHLDCSTRAGQAQYEALVKRLVTGPEGFQYNGNDWGLGEHSLEERVIGPAPTTP